jgi:hypothetical protein
MRILFIHGRAQQGREQEILGKEWKDALIQSFTNAKIDVPHFDFDFPYYGDELVRLQGQFQEQISSGAFKMKGKIGNPVEAFERELLLELGDNAKIDLAEAAREFGPEIVEKGVANHKLPLYIIRYLDKYWRGAGNYSISKVTRDVAAYLIVPSIRRTINNIVREKLTGEPTIVIAHSLGSVIAYDILRELPAEKSKIRSVITLGSPLGVQAIKRQLDGSPTGPECLIGNWLNLRDNLDLVALNALDGVNFNVSPPIENIDIENSSDDHHGISGYLSNIEVARFILKELG